MAFTPPSKKIESKGSKEMKHIISGQTMKTTTVNIREYQWEWVEKKATRQLTKSKIMRDALDEYMNKHS